MLKDGVLYNTHGSYLSGTTRKYYMIDGKYATKVQGIVFKNKSMSYASSELVLTTEVTPKNGYLVIEEQSQFLIHPEISYPIPETAAPEESDWFGKEKTNFFPDGRYATAEWSIGASDQELYAHTNKTEGLCQPHVQAGFGTYMRK